MAGCSTGVRAATPHQLALPDPTATQPYQRQPEPLVMNVLAHPDDDLFFMNPDTLHTLQSGAPGGVGVRHSRRVDRREQRPVRPKRRHHHDIAAYSSARHQGLRQAYATMLGLPHFTPWQREVISLTSGLPAEVNTLTNGRVHARLVFLQVSMHE